MNWILLILIVVIVLIPLVFMGDSEFEGADDQAGDIIGEINPDYEPWAEPLWEPPSGEIESLLFSLQVALGAGVFGYIFGMFRERRKIANNR
jgi:cobalt/nickel transport protein